MSQTSSVLRIENPNLRALTLEIGPDSMMRGVRKVSMTQKTENLEQICPLAKTTFDKAKFITRMEIFTHDGKTRMTLTNSICNWDERPDLATRVMASIDGAMQSILQKGSPLIGAAKARSLLTVIAPFSPTSKLEMDLVTIFDKAIGPELIEDGGAMELAKITQKEGVLNIDVLMMGSCSGCSSAQERTLKAAQDAIQVYLDTKKISSKATIHQTSAPSGFVIG